MARLASGTRSRNVTLRNNQIFGNMRWNIIFSGTYAGQNVQDWQTGVTVTTKSQYWTVEGNTVVGNGTEGWLWWHTAYNAPGSWTLTRSTFVKFDNNRWYHSGQTNVFHLPQSPVTYGSFVNDLHTANGLYELNSSWQTPPALSCTMP